LELFKTPPRRSINHIVIKSLSLTGSDDLVSLDVLDYVLEGSTNFSAMAEVLMPRIGEWFVQNPFDPTFSAIIDSSNVFEKLAEFVVESERWISHGSPSSVLGYFPSARYVRESAGSCWGKELIR
jgi:hypothetical protein